MNSIGQNRLLSDPGAVPVYEKANMADTLDVHDGAQAQGRRKEVV